MNTRKRVSAVLCGVLATAALTLVGAAGPASAVESYSVQTLYFTVDTGPRGNTPCTIIGDLYVPDAAGPQDRRPAVLTTNGFGGSKDDQAGIGKALAGEGYVVLSYSGLGFGGSSCKITLDHPAYDGKAATQLIDFLAGAEQIAYTDAAATTPEPALNMVALDAPGDPRLGMIGGSYGGAVQFATAAIDDRLDTIVPLITWNDLSYSLGPNNTDQFEGVSTTTPGSAKAVWALGFSALGLTGDLANQQPELSACPNFVEFVCPTLVAATLSGALPPFGVSPLREASVRNFMDEVQVPTLLIQGENDTLFNLNEAVATYEALQAQGTEVKMIWSQFGHSGPAAPGELDLEDPDPDGQYITGRVFDWFEHYLRDQPVQTGPEFAYFRDWIEYSGNAEPAFGTSAQYPVGSAQTYYLSGKDLVTQPRGLKRRSQTFLAPLAGLPTSTDPIDVIGSIEDVEQPLPEIDVPGTFAQYTTPALADPLSVVGSPVVNLKVNAPLLTLTQAVDTGKLVLFLKLRDVAPDGSKSLIRALVAPVRVPDVTKRFEVTLPAIAHRFAPGHQLELTVAGGSTNYRGNTVLTPVTIATGSQQQRLSLPTLQAQ